MIQRHAPVAAVMNGFYWDLFGVDRATPYPRTAVEHALGVRNGPPHERATG